DITHLIIGEHVPAPIIVTKIDLANKKTQLGINLAQFGDHFKELVDAIAYKLPKYHNKIFLFADIYQAEAEVLKISIQSFRGIPLFKPGIENNPTNLITDPSNITVDNPETTKLEYSSSENGGFQTSDMDMSESDSESEYDVICIQEKRYKHVANLNWKKAWKYDSVWTPYSAILINNKNINIIKYNIHQSGRTVSATININGYQEPFEIVNIYAPATKEERTDYYPQLENSLKKKNNLIGLTKKLKITNIHDYFKEGILTWFSHSGKYKAGYTLGHLQLYTTVSLESDTMIKGKWKYKDYLNEIEEYKEKIYRGLNLFKDIDNLEICESWDTFKQLLAEYSTKFEEKYKIKQNKDLIHLENKIS
ncbi:hypothetical protein BB560_005916, partial [Smittium megazygosporum]